MVVVSCWLPPLLHIQFDEPRSNLEFGQTKPSASLPTLASLAFSASCLHFYAEYGIFCVGCMSKCWCKEIEERLKKQ